MAITTVTFVLFLYRGLLFFLLFFSGPVLDTSMAFFRFERSLVSLSSSPFTFPELPMTSLSIICRGYAHLVTTTGLVADQRMCDTSRHPATAVYLVHFKSGEGEAGSPIPS